MAISRRDLLGGWLHAQPESKLHLPIVAAGAAAGPPDDILHLLNRITYGPRPAEVAAARDLGYDAFLEEQLDPDRIDDSAADAVLATRPILTMDRRTLYRMRDSEWRAQQNMIEGMVLRAVHSRRQLLERVVEFWSDHFNVSSDDYLPDQLLFQRDVIRRHALGNFHDLLVATAKAPAMLYYLDNFNNVAGAPNENYARELLELHTLGVDGGYSEQDVKEIARAFTGWTVHNGTRTGFYFNPADHDTGSKTVLGHRLPAERGIEDGLHVLSLLAHHPQTAVTLCRKLAVRFVQDNPPPALVAEMAAVWQETRGAITAVLRTLFRSAAFRAAAGKKFRRPLDFFIGAVRATGTRWSDRWILEEMLGDLGQMPYGWRPPNGYPDPAAAWMSTGGLLARWNVAMRLTHSAYSDREDSGWGLHADLWERTGAASTVSGLVQAVALQIFGTPLTAAQAAPFIAYAADGGGGATAVTPARIARKLGSLWGLMLASPLYQWR